MLKQLSDIPTRLSLLALFILLALSACEVSADTLSPTPTLATATSVPPTATSIPAAVTVNGDVISLEDFNAELNRFQDAQAALGKTVPVSEAEERVLNDLVDQLLLAQGARELGYKLEDTDIDTRIVTLTEEVGGEDILSAWLTGHGYTSDSFRRSFELAIEAAWMRDNILATLPSTAEQVHAKQILLYNQETADEVQLRLENGVDFGDLATAYDPKTNGELGWFPRGYLLEKDIEVIAFSLEVGQSSETVVTEVGFHIIMVLDRDDNHALSPDALLALEEQVLQNWLQEAREAIKKER